ncbi:ABC transporter permease [Pseudonocardia kunmingensis]|uniref:Peptide/nickel transport system permease protein n=1 Tax=Pseudonocardia kunmingensis TaxID=630975 RepID=A0A543DP69_9PSEU|nr:ABC transporter permease [Pseudonocardia kunmingensis]TQM11121.1 peptide/nickel transport system permease protein [Pseudonocardia kunmingensis]
MNARYITWRLTQVVPTCVGILLVGFLLIHAAPGDPVLALAGQNGDAAYYAFMREKFGLDEPLPTQLAVYTGNVLQADFGDSYVQGRPAMDAILERLPATVLLTGAALMLSTVGGIAFGLLAASRPWGVRDVGVSTMSLGLYAAPVFWVGQLAVLTLALGLGVFPIQGMTTARDPATGWALVLDIAHHLALPALVLAAAELAAISRLTRAGLVEELGRDHIRTARAKGVPEHAVLLKHGLRRALLPVVTVIGGRVGHLVSGAIVVEVVFGWPGIGQLLLSSMQNRDAPIVLGVFVIVALTVVLANLVTDFLYAFLDPRIRYR